MVLKYTHMLLVQANGRNNTQVKMVNESGYNFVL